MTAMLFNILVKTQRAGFQYPFKRLAVCSLHMDGTASFAFMDETDVQFFDGSPLEMVQQDVYNVKSKKYLMLLIMRPILRISEFLYAHWLEISNLQAKQQADERGNQNGQR